MRVLIGTFIIIILSFATAFSQEVEVEVTGVWELANITPEKARLLALEDAKSNALREAGIAEEFIVLNTGTVSDRINRFISSSNSELLGEIVEYQILNEEIQSKGRHHFFQVRIRAKVKKGRVKRDLAFDVYINGIKKSVYKDGELFMFSLKPTKDCYVNVFWFNEEGKGGMVFPNIMEPTIPLVANETYLFPRTQDYKARKETDAPIDILSLVFVFTKQKVFYTEECSLDKLQQWILTIPSDQRLLKYNSIMVSFGNV